MIKPERTQPDPTSTSRPDGAAEPNDAQSATQGDFAQTQAAPEETLPEDQSQQPPVCRDEAVRETSAAETSSETAKNTDRKRQRRQSVSLLILAVFAVLFAVYFARPILMPLVMASILTLLLRPLIRRCRRYRIPDAVSAALALASLLLVVGLLAANLVGPARDWIEDAPRNMRTVGEKLRFIRDEIRQISQASSRVQEMAVGEAEEEKKDQQDESLIEKTIEELTASESVQEELQEEAEKPIPVEVRQPGITTGLSVLSVTGGFLAGVVITVVLTYFLLATGDRLLNNVLHVTPTFREKRIIVEMVYEVESGVSSYLVTVTLINLGLGFAIGTAMWLLGMPNPVLWGAMGTILNFIPYLGAMTGTVIVFLVAVLSFDSISYACLVPLAYFCLTALEGNIITPSLLGRRMSMSPVVVFLSLVFWGWMWGIGGALIAVPVLTILKVGFDQFERTKPIGTLLGG